jgi:hypothetical protein
VDWPLRKAARIGLSGLASAYSYTEPPEDDEAFQRYLEADICNWDGGIPDEVDYYISVGLAAFGHRDRLSRLIECMPNAGGSGWREPLWPVAFLGYLLPNQFIFSPLDNTDQFTKWLSANQDRLSWNNNRGLYITDALHFQ